MNRSLLLVTLALCPAVAHAGTPSWDTIKAGADKFGWDDIALAFTAEVAPEATVPNMMDPVVPDRPAFDSDKCRAAIDDLAIAAQAALSGIEDLPGRIAAFNRFFFVDQAFTYRPADGNGSVDGVLVDRVLATRQGDLVGLSLIYMAVAEKLAAEYRVPTRVKAGPSIPLAPVWAPDHLFLRVAAPNYRRNIEISRQGMELQDSSYIVRFHLPDDVVARGVYLQEMDKAQMVGILSYVRGNLFFYRGDWENARGHYTAAIGDPADGKAGLYPRLVNAILRRGRCLFERSDLHGAEADFSRALSLIPHFPPAYLMRGRVYYDLVFHPAYRTDGPADREFLDSALRDLTAAIRLDPDNAEPYRLRARVLEALGRPEDAVADLKAFSVRTPEERSREAATAYGREVEALAPLAVLSSRAAGDYSAAFDAVATLARLGSTRAIPVLIDSLSDPNVRFRWQVVHALAAITDVDKGTDIEAWRTWYEANKGRLTPDPAPSTAGQDIPAVWPPEAQ